MHITTSEYGAGTNLQVLRHELTRQLSLVLLIAGGGMSWLALPGIFVHPMRFMLLLLSAILGLLVYSVAKRKPMLAQHLLLWAGTALLLVSMAIYAAPWLPFIGLVPVLVGAILFRWQEAVCVAGLVALLTFFLNVNGIREYPLQPLCVVLGSSTVVAWLVARKLFTALEWAWTMQQRADALLEQARDHQAELGRALHSLRSTNWILNRTQVELMLARQRADEARLLKERFAANVSHELRTTLNLIVGFSEIMCLSPETYGNFKWPTALRQDVHRVYRSSSHLLEMIDDVLSLSRVDIVGLTLDCQPTRLEPLIREAASMVEHLFRDRPVTLEVEFQQNLPTLKIDRLRIRQALLNLLSNAARFTEEGAVRVTAQLADNEVVISVQDTGVGIPDEQLARVFEEFHQVDDSLHHKEGTGLGLAISKHFVKAHDGRIWVESKPGVGSTFSIALPVPGRHIPLSHLVRAQLQPRSDLEASLAVIVVDPDPEVADLVRRNLEGQEVIHLANTEPLAKYVRAYHPQAIVCNVPPGEALDMADLGLGLLSVPVVQCSLPSNARVAAERDANSYLAKPVTAERLMQQIAQAGNVRDILVVDDDLGFCQLIERMLETAGRTFSLRRAYDGMAALEEMHLRRPDLVLLDRALPKMDGFQVLEEMRKSKELARVPVILLTARS
ncbi:MAG: ATP-binding protein, partial [Anaerolineae bacterium]|nr:ATP-binding protein [Anaerolineae bacterium]